MTTPPGEHKPLSASAQKVQDAIAALGLMNRVFELEHPVRTAADAAAAVGCDVSQIAKSIIFMTRRTRRPILVVTSGANRVNEDTLATLVGEPLDRASADFVREQTGYAIGGVLSRSRPHEPHRHLGGRRAPERAVPRDARGAAADVERPRRERDVSPAATRRVCIPRSRECRRDSPGGESRFPRGARS
jgi:hypothetical protein